MATYSVPFSAVAATGVAKDIFDIQASTTARLKLHCLYLAQSTADFGGSTEIEILSVGVYRGSSLASAGGSTILPINLDARQSSTATFSGLMNSSSPGSSGTSAKLILAGAMHTATPFKMKAEHTCITVGLGERLQVRLGASSAAVTMNGTMILEEIGKT